MGHERLHDQSPRRGLKRPLIPRYNLTKISACHLLMPFPLFSPPFVGHGSHCICVQAHHAERPNPYAACLVPYEQANVSTPQVKPRFQSVFLGGFGSFLSTDEPTASNEHTQRQRALFRGLQFPYLGFGGNCPSRLGNTVQACFPFLLRWPHAVHEVHFLDCYCYNTTADCEPKAHAASS